MKEKKDERWWDIRTGGILPSSEESKIILYTLLGISIFTILYIASFYLDS